MQVSTPHECIRPQVPDVGGPESAIVPLILGFLGL